MEFFLLGVVCGGLALWVYMREHVLRLEAEISAASLKKQVVAASTPVKTRQVGTGGSKASGRAAAKPAAAAAAAVAAASDDAGAEEE